MQRSDRPRLGDQRRLLRGYAPIVAVLVAFLLMVELVPTVAREQLTDRVTHETSGTGAAMPSGPQQAGPQQPGSAASQRTIPGSVVGGTSLQAVAPCTSRAKQVPGDPYSPPCIAYSGDNGGATTRGVTRDTIRIGFRITADSGFFQALAQLAGATIVDTYDDLVRTGQGLVDYFNRNFQFYGRKLQLVPFQGQGGAQAELIGSGQAQANADAIQEATGQQVFADMTGFTEPYGDALARQKVIGVGSLYLSEGWLDARRPYAWSPFTNCSYTERFVAEWLNKRLVGKPAAAAGADLRGQTRRIALVTLDNPAFQECADQSQQVLKAAGNDYAGRIAYTLDLTTLSSQAASIISKLKDEGITTIFCPCDPITPVFLTAKAHEQGYYPEWITDGSGLLDHDLLGQLYDQTEWVHSFGISPNGPPPSRRATLGYAAYRSVRSDEPAVLVDWVYQLLFMVAVGADMAGPDLTPTSFEQGLRRYPGGDGPWGTWSFPDKEYTPTPNAMELWWDPNRISPYNGQIGAYVSNGRRYTIGHVPAGDPAVFGR